MKHALFGAALAMTLPAPAAAFTLIEGTKDFTVEALLAHDGVVFLATQDDGIQTMGLDGKNVKQGLALRGYCVESDGTKVYACTDDGVHMTADKGATWSRLGNFPKSEAVYSLAAQGETLFAGTYDGLYVSRDGGAKWALTGANLNTDVTEAVAVSGDLVYAGANTGGFYKNGRLLRSEDAGKTWKAVTWDGGGEVLDIRFTGSYLHVATTSGYRFSADKGTTWTHSPAQWAVYSAKPFFDPSLDASDGAVFYSVDEQGYISQDNGLTWSTLKDVGLFGASAWLKSGNTLWAGTGNGVFMGQLAESIPVRPQARAAKGRAAPMVRSGLAGMEGNWVGMDGRAHAAPIQR